MNDVDELLRLIDALKAKELMPANVRVGSVSVTLGRVLGAAEQPEDLDDESPQEAEARMRREIEEQWATQYGAAAGGVPGMPD